MEIPPPTGYSVRRPTTDDLGDVAAFLELVTVAEFGEPDYSEEELRDGWAELDLAADAWLVLAPEGGIAGYASVGHRDHVRIDTDCYVRPEHEGRGIGTFLVRTTEARARGHVPLAPPGARVVLNNGINGRNAAARSLLEREGYAAARHFWRMAIAWSPNEPPPAPIWPDGIALRTVGAADDERAAYLAIDEAFRDHWGHVPAGSFEDWRRRAKGADFDPTLWFLAFSGAEPAGAILCRKDLGVGYVDSLGVRRRWRRRGLGLALLRHAFAEFHRRGWTGAALGVDAENETGATRLYEGAGMHVSRQYAIYQKELRPGAEPVPGTAGG